MGGDAATPLDGLFTIDCPDTLAGDCKWQVVVESFTTTQVAGPGYIVYVDSISQAASFSTSTKCSTTALLMGSTSDYRRAVEWSSVGAPLNDYAFLNSKIMRIRITTLDGGTPMTLGDPIVWALSLVIIPVPK